MHIMAYLTCFDVAGKNCFSQLLNVHKVSDVRHVYIYIAELLIPDISPFGVEIAIAKLEEYKLAGNDPILAKLIQAGGETLLSEIHELINSVWNKEELPDQWKESMIVPIHKEGDKTDCNITAINFIQHFIQYLPNKIESMCR
jgi:hypothetical protein